MPAVHDKYVQYTYDDTVPEDGIGTYRHVYRTVPIRTGLTGSKALLFRANTSSIFRREGLQPHLALVDTSQVRRLHKPRPAIVIDALHDCVIHELIGAEVPPEPLNLRVVAIIKDEDAASQRRART